MIFFFIFDKSISYFKFSNDSLSSMSANFDR